MHDEHGWTPFLEPDQEGKLYLEFNVGRAVHSLATGKHNQPLMNADERG
jgi:hypothetical protein